jgi:hypothetical protein
MSTVALEVELQRKQHDLPAFVVIPAARLRAWRLTGTTTVDACLDRVDLGRRSLKRWDAERWFLELRREHVVALGKAIGARARLTITRAPTELPAELRDLLDTDSVAKSNWQGLSAARQRVLREEVLAAKTSAGRANRARRALSGASVRTAKPGKRG